MSAVIQSVAASTTLHSLALGGGKLLNDAGQELGRALAAPGCALTSLALSECKMDDLAGAIFQL